MYNFFSDPEMKNSRNLEDENDLTQLSLWFGVPKKSTTQSLIPSPPTLIPPQTNSTPFMQIQIPCTNPSLFPSSDNNPNPILVPSSDCNPNPTMVPSSDCNPNPAIVPSSDCDPNPFLVPSSDFNPNLSLVPSSNHKTNFQDVAPDVDVNAPTPSMRRSRCTRSQRSDKGKSETVTAPFPWATDRRATVHNRKYLLQNNIYTVMGKFHCRRCNQEFEMNLDLEQKVTELRKFIQKQKGTMHDRAPEAWVNPVLPKCVNCGRENSSKPVIERKKRKINWLFLLLGQMLGFCTLEQLRYFCRHTNNHRTGAKDRLLYLTYMSLCKQLVPEWFDS